MKNAYSNKHQLIFMSFLFFMMLGCTPRVVTVEVTRQLDMTRQVVVTQEVEVTREVRLEVTPTLPIIGVLKNEETQRGTVVETGSKEAWTFEGKAGENIFFQFETISGSIAPFAQLYGGDGTLYASSIRISDFEAALNFEPPLDGDYILAVTGLGSGTGTYEVTMFKSNAELAIEYGQTLRDYVTTTYAPSGNSRIWTFHGETRQIVTITMNSDSIDASLQLLAPDGTTLISNNDSEQGNLNAIITRYLTVTGNYTIIAKSGLSEGLEVGPYDLTLTLAGNFDPATLGIGGPIEFGQTVTDVLLNSNGVTWVFTGVAGQVITIAMQSNAFDSMLELRNSSGESLESDDDSGGKNNALIQSYTLPATGEYHIIARGYSYSSVQGPYTLTLTLEP